MQEMGPAEDNRDPRKLNLLPKDMVDQTAFEHDIAYYDAGADGITGALFNQDVRDADIQLTAAASNVIEQYGKGGFDPITRTKISERTYKEAILVYRLFSIT